MGLSVLLSLFPKLFLDMFAKANFKMKVLMLIILMIIVVSSTGYLLTKEEENEIKCVKCPSAFIYTPADGLLHVPDSHSSGKRKGGH